MASAATSLVTVAHTTSLRQGDAVMGVLPATQPIHIEVALKLRNRDALDSFIATAGKNRKAGIATHPMSQSQFLANHAPTQVQAQTVANYLTKMGYKNVVIAPNRLLISADGTAATARNAFLTTMSQVKTYDGRIAFANTDEVRIPASLQGSILSVVGLQTVHEAHTFARRALPNAAHTNALIAHNPVEYSSIYSATGVPTAAGVTVGIFTNGDVSPAITDLNTFTTNNSLAAVTTSVVTTNGGGSSTAGQVEWDIDSQDIVGMGGGQVGQLIFYTAPTLSDSDMLANFNSIVAANAAKIINVSIGGCEIDAQQSGTAAATDQILAVGDAQGQTFSISTGDSGADECHNGGITPSWPADSPYALAIAGTTLDASTTTWNSEVVWGGSGGSPSTFELKPSWQELLVPGKFRGVADVSFEADPNTGSLVVVNGGLQQWGGTSLAAPIFSGMWARVLAVKGTDFGFAGPLIFQLPQSDFHDITVGNNDGEKAKVGYDFASGRGSIVLDTAINHLGVPTGSPPIANFSYTVNGLRATFTDSSTDSDGTVNYHFWNFGDNTAVSTAINPTHNYAGAGTYNVSETVADNDLNVVTKTIPVTVVATGGSNQLIVNSGFENGAAPWGLTAGVLNNNASEPAHGGQWDAKLDGYGQAHTDFAQQTLTIPTHKTSATLTFWLHIDSNEVTTNRKFDKLSVDVYNTSGALLGNVASFSNLDKAAGYIQHSYDMSAYIGQKIKLKFTGTEDASIATTFVIDDVTLLAK